MALELADDEIPAPKSAKTTALGGGNRIFNLNSPTGLEDQELPTDIDSDVTSMGSFGANDDDLTYLGSR